MPVSETDFGDDAVEALLQAGSIAVLTGAGVSAESGVPTFRGPGALWRGRDPLSLATPEAFAADPRLVWEFYNFRRTLLANVEPNPAHHALAALEGIVPTFTLITQNVDRLHHRAGSRNVLEVHGNLHDVRCSACGRTFDRTGVELPPLPRCEACGALVRPAVVWFGEALPEGVWAQASAAALDADVMLVVGTSALVYPAAGLAATARRSGGFVIEINLEPALDGGAVDIAFEGKAGEILPKLVAELARQRAAGAG